MKDSWLFQTTKYILFLIIGFGTN